MSDRVQDLTNHRKVAVACKNYTDKEVKKAKDELITFFSRNTVETDDHTNELAYQITAPSGAKLLQLQAIGGNTVKLSPSVASDSTKAMIKTMPSVVYDFDVSQIDGASEVSDNLMVLQDVQETTINGITYSVSNGVLKINGTATASFGIYINANIIPIGTYTIGAFNDKTPSGSYGIYLRNRETSTNVPLSLLQTVNSSYTVTTTFEYNQLHLWLNTNISFDNVTIKPMLVKGSTAPTVWKQGFTGIHNLELSGLKVDGANLVDISNRTITSRGYLISKTIIDTLPIGTYTFSFDMNVSGTCQLILQDANDNTSASPIINCSIGNNSIAFTTTRISKYITLYANIEGGCSSSNFMLNRGSTALTYVDYVQPTTLPIDLSSILYNGSPLFENGLCAKGSVKDSIEPYKATKKWTYRTETINSTNLIYESGNTRFVLFLRSYDGALLKPNATGIINLPFVFNEWNLVDLSYFPFRNYQQGKDVIFFRDDSITTVEEFIAKYGSLFYGNLQLNNPIEVSIDWSATLRGIQGYPNGSIIAENTNNMDVESVITYNSIIQETLCPSVTVDGANLADNVWESGSYNATTGEYQSANSLCNNEEYLEILSSQSYSQNNNLSYGLYFHFYDSNKNYISHTSLIANNGTFTTPSNAKYMRWNTGTNYADTRLLVMLNEGSTALSYRPYKASITRNLPTQASDGWSAGTQRNYRVLCDYEGNAVNKRYTNVDKEDMGTPTWNYSGGSKIFYSSDIASIVKKPSSTTTLPNILINNYEALTPQAFSSNPNDMNITIDESNGNIRVHNPNCNDATIFKSLMTGNPLFYEKNETDETDIDDFDYFFDVEEGDVITFNNPYAQQVYATYSFIIKEAKSNE